MMRLMDQDGDEAIDLEEFMSCFQVGTQGKSGVEGTDGVGCGDRTVATGELLWGNESIATGYGGMSLLPRDGSS